MYIALLKKCILDCVNDPEFYSDLKTKQVSKASKEQIAQIETGQWMARNASTMIGWKRLNNIEMCFHEIVKNKIPGDLIETGVWRGGATVLMAGLCKYHKENRKVYVCDSFEGLPPPDYEKYPKERGGGAENYHKAPHQWGVSLEEVKRNFERVDLLDDNVIFVKGFFEHSLKNADIGQLAMLRLDGDMYSSTMQALVALYDKVSKGGYIIVDDFCLAGCVRAITDFRQSRNITSEIKTIDWTGRYWIKEEETVFDFKK